MIKARVLRATTAPEELVCIAARGDYSKTPPWEQSFAQLMKPIKGVPEYMEETTYSKQAALLRQLMDAGHWGPWEHPVITFGISNMSRVTLARLTRHRIASFDIQSQRYVKMNMLNFVVPPSFSAKKIKSRQGTKEIALDPLRRKAIWEDLLQHSHEAYRELVDAGVPKEDARYLLPEGTFVHGTMTVNARSLMHIIALRSFGDAQWEIRELVKQLLILAKEWMPITFTHFEKRMKKRDVIAP